MQVSRENILKAKLEYLEKCSKYFSQLKIDSKSSTKIQKKHYDAIHVYFKVLDYYTNTDFDIVLPNLYAIEELYLELKKSLYLLNVKTYA